MHDSNWVFGSNNLINFPNGQAPAASQTFSTNNPINAYEGCSTISDDNGNLIAYTDGERLWDGAGNIVSVTGTGSKPMGGDNSSTHSSIIIPPAGGGADYHVFCVGSDNETSNQDVTHMTFRENGNTIQEVLPPQRLDADLSLTSISNSNVAYTNPDNTERLAATSHVDCDKYWLVTQRASDGLFQTVLVDSDSRPSVFTASTDPQFIPNSVWGDLQAGCMAFSPDGTTMAYALRHSNRVFVYDFDNATGAISNSFVKTVIHPYGVEFSPDSQTLYYSYLGTGSGAGGVVACDLITQNTTTLHNGPEAEIGALQLGPNGILYGKIVNSSDLFSIKDPNAPLAPNNIQRPAKDNNGDDIQLVPSSGFTLPTFTRLTDICANNLCDLRLISQICDEDGNTQIIVEMVNQSNNAQIDMTVALTGIPDGMFSVSTSASNNIHQATIIIDGIFQGPVSLTGSLSGMTGNVGARLCCKRSLDLMIDACAEDCLEITGEWKKSLGCFSLTYYEFTVTNISSNSSFLPNSVEITNLPQGAILLPNPVPLVNGAGTGKIFISDDLPPGTELGLLFHAESWDQCCNKWINLIVPTFKKGNRILKRFAFKRLEQKNLTSL